MKIKTLTAALACALPMTGAFAAALDRSGQSISSFLQPGNYFEVGGSVLAPDVSGKENSGNKISDMAQSYAFASAAIKIQATDNFSVGLLFDQPFGAKAAYSGDNIFVSKPTNNVLGALPVTTAQLAGAAGSTAPTGNTEVSVETHNLALIFGFQPNENFNFYAGPVYQEVKGDVNLRGSAYSLYNGYDAHIKNTDGWGWLAGIAYQIPEIALKASLTYRSEIDHDVNIEERTPLVNDLTTAAGNGALAQLMQSLGSNPNIAPLLPSIQAAIGGAIAANGASSKETRITTPQSVNLDLQSGIMADTVAFVNIRWVNWEDFALRPYKFGAISEQVGGLLNPSRPNGFNLVQYSKDQWSVTTGVGRKFSDKWAGNASVGWDSGAGNPVTTLGPTEGYWNVGLGLQYSPAPNYFVAGGVKYFWLGDAKAQTGAQAGSDQYVAEFSDNNAIAYGLKLGYRF
ncbi:OmpP1/FadL family transporter [Acinetobacter puyangensis]|uniref:OmpP1/FadL family transporter n=1 Tax=Acinetobacter puyangensis TaxID=1096779 RepID=UPI003A4D46B0